MDPVHDPERVARVVGTRLLDTPPEPAFDRLTRVACRALCAPIGHASLITSDRQFLKSSGGAEDPCAPGRELALTHTYCLQVVRTGRPFVVSDARALAQWREHPVVTELGLIAYVGVPVRSNGYVLGTLCVLDRVARDWRSTDVELLEDLAGAVAGEIEHRRERLRMDARVEQQRVLAGVAQRVLEGTPRLQEVLLETVGGLADALQVDRCAVVERRPEGSFVVTAGLGRGVLPGPIRPSPALRSALSRVLSQPRRRPVVLEAGRGALSLHRPRRDAGAPTSAAVLAPAGPGASEVLVALSSAPREFTTGELELMSGFARVLGSASRRARIDDELRVAARRTRALLDSVSEGVCGLDQTGRVTFANAAAARLLGFGDAGELLGRRLESFIRAKRAAAAPGRGWVQVALEESRASHAEREALQRADGDTFLAECRAVPLPREGAVVTITDVTERAQAEADRERLLEAQRRAVEAAERSSAELSALLAAAPIGIGLVDADLRYRRLNLALAELNGVPAEEHIGRRVRDVIRGPVGASLEALLRRVIATGEPIRGVEVVHAMPTDPREDRVVLGSAYPVTIDGRVQGIGVACFEVTDLKRHEEEQRLLSEASSLLSSFDFTANLRRVAALLVPRLAERCVVYQTERDGSLHVAADERGGPAVARPAPARDAALLALANESVRTRRTLVSPPIVGQETDPGASRVVTVLEPSVVRALASEGVSAIMSIPLRHGDEDPTGVLLLCSAAKDRRNTPAGLRLAREVARRVTLAKERTRLFLEAQDATRSREHVLAVVSHDLRTPLTTILMAAARLLLQSPGPELIRPLELIERAARTMKRLIDDLVDFAAIETGRLRVDARPEEAAQVVFEVVSSFQQVADAGQVVLEAEVAPELPPIQADRERIAQVLSNIVGNALKVTPPAGRVAVRARPAGRFVQFSVADTGRGIPREQLQAVFERYWRGEEGGCRGVGLGLAIAKGIVEAHGGTISAESEPGAGATFYFTVPTLATT